MQQAEYTIDPSTERGKARRDRIIAAATELFHEYGFHATGIDEIGAAAGITGPGVYRHFAAKEEILIAVLDRIWMMLREGIDAAAALQPQEALDTLIEAHVRLSVRHRAEFTLLIEDLRFLPVSYQELAGRNRATYRDAWADAIATLREDVSIAEARLMTVAAWRLSAGTSVAMDVSGLDDGTISNRLIDMTRAALMEVHARG